MIDYGPEPDNQMGLDVPGVDDTARERWEQAKAWKDSHFKEWTFYKRNAWNECCLAQDRKASPNTCLSDTRRKFRTSLPNAWAAALARMAMEEDPRLQFRMARSMFDPIAETKL